MAFVVIAAVVLFSQGSGSVTPSEASTKQYTVKKSREAAQGIASSDRKVDHALGDTPSTQPVQSLTPDAVSKTSRIQVPVDSSASVPPHSDNKNTETGVEAIIAKSFSADTAQIAIDLLAEALAEAQAADDTSKLYSTIGSLQLAQEDPNTEEGLAALRKATESATSPTMRSQAAIAEASALVVHANSKDGLARINELLEDDSIEDEGAHHLSLLRGDLLVEQGDLRTAESVYESVRTAVTPTDGGGDALYRQASLRLARLYARTGDDKRGAIIARDLKQAATPQR